jgi:hypothetical protein
MRIDNNKNDDKPISSDVGYINNSINRSPDVEVSLKELCISLSSGKSIVLDSYIGIRNSSNFIRTNMIGIDIDYLDSNIENTSKVLLENNLCWYLRYKSFSYGKPHKEDNSKIASSHRYILKFDEYLNKREALSIYKYLESILDVDKATTNNLCRLWFGTNHEIAEEDSPGNVLKKSEVLDNIEMLPEVQNKIDFFTKIRSTEDVIFIIENVDFDKFKTLLNEEFENWDYHEIRDGIYSVCMIMLCEYDDNSYIEYFINQLEPHRVSRWEKSIKHDTINRKYGKRRAMGMIRQFARVYPNDVRYMFDILLDEEGKANDFESLNDNFITTTHIKSLEYGINLLCAGAGSGKTTAVVNRAIEDSSQYRILIVPTIAICEQLELKYGDNNYFEFLYSGKNKKEGTPQDKVVDGHISLTICTYDAYVYRGKIEMDHILYLDEAHEMLSFRSIDGKRDIIDFILYNLPNNCVFMTATPFNLADVFSKKLFFKRNNNKKTTIVNSNKVTGGIKNIISSNFNQKILIYINSKAKSNKLAENIRNDFGLRVGEISASTRNGAYQNLLNNNIEDYDVVITTKFLNIGFDIQGLFNVLIYAEQRVLPNDLLQFFNRERQKADYYILRTNSDAKSGFMINTSYLNYESKLNHNYSNWDKHLLDNKHVKGKMNPHVVCNDVFYRKSNIGTSHIEQLFKLFYNDFSLVIEIDMNDSYSEVERKNIHQQYQEWCVQPVDTEDEDYIEGMNTTFELNYYKFIFGKKVKFPDDINPSVRRKIYFIFACQARHRSDDDIDPSGQFYHVDSYTIGDLDKLYYSSDLFKIDRFESNVIKNIFWRIAREDVISETMKENYTTELNNNYVLIDNNSWNDKNFKSRLNKFDIYFKRVRVRIDGNQVWVLKNLTNLIEKEDDDY